MSSDDRDWAKDLGDNPLSGVPITVADSAVAIHELYASFVKAGFSEAQAFTLVLTTLTITLQSRTGE